MKNLFNFKKFDKNPKPSQSGDIKKTDITIHSYKAKNFVRVEFLIRRDKDFINKVAAIAGCLPADFEKIFGKCNFDFVGEFNNKCWHLNFRDKEFVIVSANNRGTTIEGNNFDIQPENNSKQDIITLRDFINKLFDTIVESGNTDALRWVK